MADVDLEGADTLARTLAGAADQLGDLSALHQELGTIIVASAGPLTPVRTGALRAATTAVAGPDTTDLRNPRRYAIPVHFGARGVPARPFLTRAATSTEAAQLAAAERHIQHILDTVKGA